MIDEESEDIILSIDKAFVSYKRLKSFLTSAEYAAPDSYNALKAIEKSLQLIKRKETIKTLLDYL